MRDQLGSKLKTWLDAELAVAEKRLKQAEGELIEFSKEHDIVVTDRSPNPKIGEFEKAGQEWVRQHSKRLELEGLQFEREQNLPTNMSDDYLQTLKKNLTALRAEYTGLVAIYNPEYFKVALLRNKIKSTEQAIEEIEQNNLSTAIDAAKKKESTARDAYDRAKQDAFGMSSLAVKYGILKKSVEANDKIYMMLLQRLKQVELDQGTMGYQTVLVNTPSLPLTPSKPNKAKILFTGAILGLVGGLALGLCLELVDNTVQTTREIRDRLNLPLLGVVPVIEEGKDETKTDQGGREFTAHLFPASPFADAVRIIQNTASVAMQQESACSLVVTSALPLEGKTLLSVVMGTVIASEKKKALIVDCDLRNPRIRAVFQGAENDPGLTDLLVGKAVRLREGIRQSQVPGLYYIPAGFIPQNPVALLKSDRFRDILEACKKVFDVVILDTPPVLGLVDARIVAAYADGLIIVAKAGRTPLAVLREATEAVLHARGRLLGIVLNMADYKRRYGYGSGYYGSRYYNRYYHRYYHRSYHSGDSSSGRSGSPAQ
ncbi:MAG: polysaccharide biosynthesis tyrosine autokinase [Deltaproteobacteria bacterium]|nr:polysaccharide biosynthesis tyrosine autokinase [Deltaproteobacteria bacterium]